MTGTVYFRRTKTCIWCANCYAVPSVLLCTKFHQDRFMISDCRRLSLLNVQCQVARQWRLSWQPHHGGHVGGMMGCHHPTLVQFGQLLGELWHFQNFPIWRPSAILNWNFVILDHPRSRLCAWITLSKFRVDPMFAIGDIAILWFCQFG